MTDDEKDPVGQRLDKASDQEGTRVMARTWASTKAVEIWTPDKAQSDAAMAAAVAPLEDGVRTIYADELKKAVDRLRNVSSGSL
jgi:hypothetical protein